MKDDASFKRSPIWKERKEIVLEDDGYKCALCGKDYKSSLKTGNPVSVYSIARNPEKPLSECSRLELMTLCRFCYEKQGDMLRRRI